MPHYYKVGKFNRDTRIVVWVLLIHTNIVVKCNVLVNLANMNEGILILISKVGNKVMCLGHTFKVWMVDTGQWHGEVKQSGSCRPQVSMVRKL